MYCYLHTTIKINNHKSFYFLFFYFGILISFRHKPSQTFEKGEVLDLNGIDYDPFLERNLEHPTT